MFQCVFGVVLYCFGVGLQDVNLYVVFVFVLFDVYWVVIVFFDGYVLMGEFGEVVVGEGEGVLFGFVYIYCFYVFSFGVDYFFLFVVVGVVQYGFFVLFQCGFVDEEFVGVYCVLYYYFFQVVGGGDEYCVLEVGFGVEGKCYV